MPDAIGFIGLGGMGVRMAARVLNAGYPLTVFNRTAERVRPLVERGARVAGSPREVAADSDVVITMLSDPSAVRAVLHGPDGVLAGAARGTVLIDMSTVGPSDARANAEAAAEHGVRFIQAPVMGSLGPAESGELVILAGGDRELVDAQRPLLDTMGRAVQYLGPPERASALKLSANALLLGSQGLFAEVVALASRWGLPRDEVLAFFGASPIVSPALKGRIGGMFAEGGETSFSLNLGRKDLWLALAAGYEVKASLPLIATALETYSMASREHGAEDIARIAAFIDEVSG